jgi:uncharacterized membrane protein
MNTSQVLVLAFLIGAVAGLRSMTAPAIVAWAVHEDWLPLHHTRLEFMGATATVVIFTVLAVVELITDKLPSTPSRLAPAGLIARAIFGGLSGATVALGGEQSVALGVVLGVIGSAAGAFGGHAARSRLVRALKVRDWVIAVSEDVVAIVAGLAVVSQF